VKLLLKGGVECHQQAGLPSARDGQPASVITTSTLIAQTDSRAGPKKWIRSIARCCWALRSDRPIRIAYSSVVPCNQSHTLHEI
jgi:hypothetical protein